MSSRETAVDLIASHQVDALTDARINARIDAAVGQLFTTLLGRICERGPDVWATSALEEMIAAEVDIVGPHGLTCGVALPASGAAELQLALLGEESAEAEAMLPDTVGELCNMIAGILKDLLVASALHTLSVPRDGLKHGRQGELEENTAHRCYRWHEHTIAVFINPNSLSDFIS